MVAKATNEPHSSPIKLKKSTSKDIYETREMTDRERELVTKCVKLIQGRIHNKEPIVMSDVSPGEDTITDMSTSMISSVMSTSSQESVYQQKCDRFKQVTLAVCLNHRLWLFSLYYLLLNLQRVDFTPLEVACINNNRIGCLFESTPFTY